MSSPFSVSLLFLGSLFITINGHICMWQPLQRGNFSIDTPGYHGCYLKTAPCGLNDRNGVRTEIEAGSNYEIKFQQNLNHFYTDNPGSLDITFAIGLQPKEEDFNISLYTIPDYNSMNEITQTNFTFMVKMPNIQCDECVIRLRYLSNNMLENDHGTIFYQCSDIKLTPRKSTTIDNDNGNENKENNEDHKDVHDVHDVHVLDESSPSSPLVPGDCCAPSKWAAKFLHKIPSINYEATGRLWYDEVNQYQRMDTQVGKGEGTTIYDGRFTAISNFSNGIEYFVNVNEKVCSLFGLDYWNSWCFGEAYNQSETLVHSNIPCINNMNNAKDCKQWVNGNFTFESFNGRGANEACLPSSLSRTDGEVWLYYDYDFSDFNSTDVFTPSPICDKTAKYVGCSKAKRT